MTRFKTSRMTRRERLLVALYALVFGGLVGALLCVGCIPIILLRLRVDPFKNPTLQTRLLPCMHADDPEALGWDFEQEIAEDVFLTCLEAIRYGDKGTMFSGYLRNESAYAVWIDPHTVLISGGEEAQEAPVFLQRVVLMSEMEEFVYIPEPERRDEIWYAFPLRGAYRPPTSCVGKARDNARGRWPPRMSERAPRRVEVGPGDEAKYRWVFAPFDSDDVAISFSVEKIRDIEQPPVSTALGRLVQRLVETADTERRSVSVSMCEPPPRPPPETRDPDEMRASNPYLLKRLEPFVREGKTVFESTAPGCGGWREVTEPQPLSLEALSNYGALESTEDGLRKLHAIATDRQNDRPRWREAAEPWDWDRVRTNQRYLRVLGPDLVRVGHLNP